MRDRTGNRDEGSALLLVMGAMTVAMIIASVALNHGLATMAKARQSVAWNEAFAAAEAGVDDFLARLNADDNYWLYVDCGNAALKGPATPPNSCGWGSSTEPGWSDVPGSMRGEFHYDIDITQTHVDGTIDLVSTGRVVTGDDRATRSIQVTLRREGFGEFLYYTTYETKDPADYANPVDKYTKCAKYFWAGRKTSDCEDITFIGGDKLNGPIHSNDSILMTDATSGTYAGKGPWFTGTVTTSLPTCKPVNGVPQPKTKCYRSGTSGGGHPTFSQGITYRNELELPGTIGDLRQFVTPGPDAPDVLGCLYTGPTRIQFLDPPTASSPAQMKVWSPWSKTGLNPGCGNAAGTWPQTLSVPANNLIMVQNVPPSQTLPAAGAPCAGGSIGGFPNADDYSQTLAEFSCRNGTVYVDGVLRGRVTISAENNVVITGNLTYEGGDNGTDALGLIAENSVQIYHPISKTCDQYSEEWVYNTKRKRWELVQGPCVRWARGTSNLTGSVTSPNVDAAILSLQHSFEVQQYDIGNNLGTIHLYGTIAQRFRGPVGQGTHGYLKDYNYDTRLRYAPPPYFLDPVRATWGQKTFGEVRPRYGD